VYNFHFFSFSVSLFALRLDESVSRAASVGVGDDYLIVQFSPLGSAESAYLKGQSVDRFGERIDPFFDIFDAAAVAPSAEYRQFKSDDISPLLRVRSPRCMCAI